VTCSERTGSAAGSGRQRPGGHVAAAGAAGALAGQSDHRVSKSLYAKDPDGIEPGGMWRVLPEDREAELSKGGMTVPPGLDDAQ
jgi:hypothetical protein